MNGPGIDVGRLRRNKPKDYLIRFLFGGIVTAVTGLIATEWGPVVGGLFLAFPAILPASLTLIASHDGKPKAGTGAAGGAVGALGLAAFAAVVWDTARSTPAWLVLATAGAAWLAVTIGAWFILRGVGFFADEDEPRDASERRDRPTDEPLVLAAARRD